MVRKGKIVESNCKPVNWKKPNINFKDYSTNGVIGTPVYSSAELGKKLWEVTVRSVTEIFKEVYRSR